MAQKYKSRWTGPQVDSAVDQITDKIDRSEIGVAGGIASLGSDGKVPSWQLPTVKSATADNFIGKDGITISKAADSEKIEISGSGLVPKKKEGSVIGVSNLYVPIQNMDTNIIDWRLGTSLSTSSGPAMFRDQNGRSMIEEPTSEK